MDEGTAQHGLDPEVRLGNETMPDTSIKLGLNENCKNQSPKKAEPVIRSRERNFTVRQFLIRNLFVLFHWFRFSNRLTLL